MKDYVKEINGGLKFLQKTLKFWRRRRHILGGGGLYIKYVYMWTSNNTGKKMCAWKKPMYAFSSIKRTSG